MFDRAMAGTSRWVLDHVAPQWVDYVVSNTMTEFNRWFNSFLWTYDLQGMVESVVDEAPGVRTFVLRMNQHWKGFTAGQHIELELDIGGETHRRCYSPSPRGEGRVSITVKRKSGGRVSNWMHDHVKPGMALRVHPARGRFVRQAQPKMLFVCAGSGITPCHSMVTDMLQGPLSQRPDVQVIAQFRSESDVIFRKDLKDWATLGLKVTTAFSDASAQVPTSRDVAPRLNEAQLQRLCPDIAQREVYLCGPEGFMSQMLADLQRLGVDLKRVHTERFELPGEPVASPEQFQVEGAEVFFENMNARITLTAADQGKTLLQVALDHGVELEHGCGKGACGTCKLIVHDGQACGNVLGKTVYLCTAYPASRELVLGG